MKSFNLHFSSFTSLRNSSFCSPFVFFPFSNPYRNPQFRYRFRHFLLIWVVVFLILFGLVILSLVIFIYLVPCPVWSGGQIVTTATILNTTNLNNSSLTSSSSSLSLFFIPDFYTWKCPMHAIFFISSLERDQSNNNNTVIDSNNSTYEF